MKARDVKGTKSNKIVAQHGKVLPKTIFAKWMLDSADAPWLEANTDIDELAEKGEEVFVGEYKLVKVGKVSLDLMVR
jgi:hypothetical protein